MLPKHLFNSAKLLGALALIQSTYTSDQLPTSLYEIRAFLPAALHGNIELERFELLDYGRPLTTATATALATTKSAAHRRGDDPAGCRLPRDLPPLGHPFQFRLT